MFYLTNNVVGHAAIHDVICSIHITKIRQRIPPHLIATNVSTCMYTFALPRGRFITNDWCDFG